MNAENIVFLELYNEDKKNIPNMRAITPFSVGLTNSEFYYALKKLRDKDIITGLKLTKDWNGNIIKAYWDGIRLTRNAEQYYENLIRTRNFENYEYSSIHSQKQSRIFVSHSSIDKRYVTAIVKLMEDIGVPENGIFCSSLFGYSIPQGEDIYSYLLKQFHEYDLKIYYVLSDNYYNSAVCMNEMGAAWSLHCESLPIFLPGFDLNHMKGAVSSNIIGIKLDADISEVKGRLGEMKDDLISRFELPDISPAKWERKRDEFIQLINDAN